MGDEENNDYDDDDDESDCIVSCDKDSSNEGGGGIMGLFCGLKREKKNEYDDDMDDYKNDSQGDGEEIGGIIDHDNASVVGDKEQEVIEKKIEAGLGAGVGVGVGVGAGAGLGVGLGVEVGAGVEVGVGVGTGAEKESANHSCYIDDSVKEMVIVVAKALLSKEFGAFRRYKIVAQKGKVNDHADDDLDDNDNIGVDEYDDDRLDFRIERVSSSINHQRIRKSLSAKEDESFGDVKKKNG